MSTVVAIFAVNNFAPMASITLSLSSKKDKQTGKVEILLRFVGGRGLVFRAKSNLFIAPERWNEKEGRVIIPRLQTPEQKELSKLQKDLDTLCNTVVEQFTHESKDAVSKEWLTSLIDRYHFPEKYQPKTTVQPFFELFDTFLDKQKLSEVRKNNYRVVKRMLQRYELFMKATSNSKYSITLDNVTTETLLDFEQFLKEEHNLCKKDLYKHIYDEVPETRTPAPRSKNTINDILSKVRTFFHWAEKMGKTNNAPFKTYSIEENVYGTPCYFSVEELQTLYKADFSHRPQLAIQRDIFVFQCTIGCRVQDLYNFTKDNIINGGVEYIARKTKEGRPVTVRVPLIAMAKEILAKYADCGSEGLLPYISQQKYNIAIKEAFKLAGLTRPVVVLNPLTREGVVKPLNEVVSSHMARRYFVGNIYKKVKDPNLVSKVSGHKEGSKAFARYRDIDEDMKVDLVKILEG